MKQNVASMADGTVTQRVVVSNPQGLHARPAEVFVKTASQFQAKIEVVKEGRRVDGKSILSILTLAAVKGTELHLEATGPDAQSALDALAELFKHNFAENETVE
jgi:phosphotransferase system HPr (HPr) family protein